MKESTRKRLISVGINAGIGLLLAVAIVLWRGIFRAQSAQEVFGDLSDGFFIAGLVLGSVGALYCIASTGFFDIFSFGGHTFLAHFVPRMNTEENRKYYNFKAARAEKRKPPLRITLFVGLAFVALSAVSLAFYYL